jgi:hypothetical protein
MLHHIDRIVAEHGAFWASTSQRLATTAQVMLPTEEDDDEDWMPEVGDHVEAQFTDHNKFFAGIVTQVNYDDTIAVKFTTNVTENNMNLDKVRSASGKPPKIGRKYAGPSHQPPEHFSVGVAVKAPFEGGNELDGEITLKHTDGSFDVTFKFNTNVTEHNIPAHKLHLQHVLTPELSKHKRALERVMKAPESKDFLRPVNELWLSDSIPGYFDIIKQPMDLGTIKAKLLAGGYDSNTSGVLADVKLTFENCMTYAQDKTSVWYLTAERMIATAEEWFSGRGSKKHKKGSRKLCTAKPSTAKHLGGAADQQKKRKATTQDSSASKRPNVYNDYQKTLNFLGRTRSPSYQLCAGGTRCEKA